MQVKHAMHEGCIWVAPDVTLSEIAEIMRDEDIGAVAVGENDRLIGILTDRDIVCRGVAEGWDVSSMTAREVMTDGLQWCWETDDMKDVLQRMESEQLRRMPVMNSDKRLVGILSMGDISHSMAHKQSGEFAASVSAHHH